MGDITKITQKHMEEEKDGEVGAGDTLRQVILGGQDGLVNVLGIVLGVAAATSDARVVIIAGLAATFAESVSMAAVAYTSARAEQDHYKKMLEKEEWEIDNLPDIETEEIRIIYRKKGFKGKGLDKIVKTITSDRKIWLDVMMKEELGLTSADEIHPSREGFVVGFSAIFGSVIPLLPFFFLDVGTAFWGAAAISLVALFLAGIVKGRLTTGKLLHDGLEMMLIGGLAGAVGYAVGALAGVAGL